MDIGSKKGYPASALSNFAPHPFRFEGVLCNSMEGFLQSLKFKEEAMQIYVCSLVGLKAKMKGNGKNWQTTQTLYWKGKPYKRESQEYQTLLTNAYYALLNGSEAFRKALKATGNAVLTHSIGRSNIRETVLTEREFVALLTQLRRELESE